MARTRRGLVTEKPPGTRELAYPRTRGQAHHPPRRREALTSTRSWLKRASSRLTLQKSTTRWDCFALPSLEKLPRAANVRASWASRPASASTPTLTSTTRTRPHERARSSSQLRRCCGPCPPLLRPRRRTYTERRGRSSSKRLCNRPRARHPAFASRAAREMTAAHRARRCQFTQVVRQDNRPTRAERQPGSESLTCADRPRMVTPATSRTPAKRATQRHGQR
jgi:hypothetical protein